MFIKNLSENKILNKIIIESLFIKNPSRTKYDKFFIKHLKKVYKKEYITIFNSLNNYIIY